MPDDKLQFSAKNLGSLAAFMNREGSGHPLHQVLDWLRLYSINDDVLTDLTDEVLEGYREDNDSDAETVYKAVA